MFAEIAAAILSAAAGSYLTYQLVVRHFTVHFDELNQKIEGEVHSVTSEAEHKANALTAEIRKTQSLSAKMDEILSQLDKFKVVHVTAIESHVKQEIKNKLSAAAVETCSVCKRLVAGFEHHEGALKCHNCLKAGK